MINNQASCRDSDDSGALSDPDHISTSRSKTMPPAGLTTQRKVSNINLDRLKNAKLAAEKAMKVGKMGWCSAKAGVWIPDFLGLVSGAQPTTPS